MDNMTPSEVVRWDRKYLARVHELRSQYHAMLPVYQAVRNRAELVLRTHIERNRISCEVTSRIKELDSIRAKIGQEYDSHRAAFVDALRVGEDDETIRAERAMITRLLRDPLSMVWDAVGIRCIGLFSDQLSRTVETRRRQGNGRSNSRRHLADRRSLEDIIAANFLDGRSEDDDDKRSAPVPIKEVLQYTEYHAEHYFVTLRPEHIAGDLEQNLKNIRIELQVRTAAQHVIDDASRYLGYKNSESLLDKNSFSNMASKVVSELARAQTRLDKLFQESRQEYLGMLNALLKKCDSQKSRAERASVVEALADMPVSAASLKLFAAYEFIALGDEPPKGQFRGRPCDIKNAIFDRFWLEELVRCIQRSTQFPTIRHVMEDVRSGMQGAADYEQSLGRPSPTFKKDDLTDILSKCLIFGSEKLHGSYPVKEDTLEAARMYLGIKERTTVESTDCNTESYG